jgi:hypothetical protein
LKEPLDNHVESKASSRVEGDAVMVDAVRA